MKPAGAQVGGEAAWGTACGEEACWGAGRGGDGVGDGVGFVEAPELRSGAD